MCKEPFDQLVQVFAALRSENGCPWDREQTHESIKPDLIEETYEKLLKRLTPELLADFIQCNDYLLTNC